MSNIITRRIIFLGLVSGLVPFVVSFLFFDRTGQLVIPQPLFKSLMVVLFGGLGVTLLVAAFRHVPQSLWSGLALGCYWLAMNIVLDLLVLLPLANLQVVVTYLYDIGLRYLLIPIISMGMGIVAARGASREPKA